MAKCRPYRWTFLAWAVLIPHASAEANVDQTPRGTSRALIIVGLPGDGEHEVAFRATAKRWRDWLIGPLLFPSSEVRILSGSKLEPGFADAPATRESILREAEVLVGKAGADDRVWVFVIGHTNVDDGHAILHLAGPDLRDVEFAGAFKALPGREQVFWVTTPASGWFLSQLSKPGRIVVAATDRDKEFNETEFPVALADVASQPRPKLDLNKDGQVSILELFEATTEAVDARFAADKRLPTEHAQLDDNGDGVGTELKPSAKPKVPDGSIASKTFLSLAPASK